jgi:MFS family permease
MSPLGSVWKDYRDAAALFSRPARLFLLCEFLAWAANGIHYVLFNLYLVEGGYAESFVGRAVSVNAAGLALAALPAGFIADRWGRRRALMLGAVLEGVGLWARSVSLVPFAIYGGSFLTGVGQALLVITAAPFITDQSTPRERTHLFTTFFSLSLFAAVVGSIAGGALPWALLALPEGLGPERLVAQRITLVLGALFSLASLVPLWRMGDLNEVPATARREPVEAAARRHVVPIAINAFLTGAGAGLIIPFMSLYFATRFACSEAQIGVIFAVGNVITATASLLGPRFAGRFGKLRTAVGIQLLSLPFLVTLGFERRLSLAVGSFWMRATLMQASTPLLSAFIMETLPRSMRARSASINTTLWHTGWAASATGAGLLIERFGYGVPFSITAVLYLTASSLLFLYFRRFPDRAAEPVSPAEGAAAHGEAQPVD